MWKQELILDMTGRVKVHLEVPRISSIVIDK